MNVTFNGNMITFNGLSEIDVIVQIQRRNLGKRQFSAMGQDDGTVKLTFPMTVFERGEFSEQIRVHNHRNRSSGNDDGPSAA